MLQAWGLEGWGLGLPYQKSLYCTLEAKLATMLVFHRDQVGRPETQSDKGVPGTRDAPACS